MNQGLGSHIDGAHQMLKSTKAKMREVLAEIAANQEEHREPQDTNVSFL